jgi:carbon monoxide dehydrogenase subunit G
MRLQRIVTVRKPLDTVFAYLSDFTTTTEWDPGTVKTVRISGDGTFGTEYLNTSTFAGRQTQLTYTVVDLVPNRQIALRGENKTVIAHDTMTFRETGSDTEVTYTADFTFKGITRLIAPLMRPAFTRLGNEAEAGMAAALERL